MTEKEVVVGANTEGSDMGTVISTIGAPSPSNLNFVVNSDKVIHRGMFVEMDYSEGTMIALISNVVKTNRYFERADSVKEFETNGLKLGEQLPAGEWEFLVAETKPLGVFTKELMKRPTYPVSPGTKVRIASKENLKNFLKFDEQSGIHLGELEYHDLSVKLNLTKLLQKHLAILALSGAGKCASPSTKILLSTGKEIEIGKLVDEKLLNGFEISDDVEFCKNNDDSLKVFSMTSENKLKESKILAFTRRKAPGEMYRIKTLTGKILELTPEHLVPILSEGIQWKQAQELNVSDSLLVPKPSIIGNEQLINLNYSSRKLNFNTNVKVDCDFAKLFGYLLAEGHNATMHMSFTNIAHEIQNDFIELFKKIFNVTPKKYKRQDTLIISRKAIASSLKKIGFTNSSWTKFVPDEILLSDKKVIAAFLSAMIDCDGYISKKSGLDICLASKELISAIESMLLRFGIVAVKREKHVKGKTYLRLTVNNAKDLAILANWLNLLIDYKRENLVFCAKKKQNPNIDVIPKISKKLERIIELLNMSNASTNSAGIVNYLYRNNNPSFASLTKIVESFEERALFLELKIMETKELFYSLPNYDESFPKEILANSYGKFDFNQIAEGTNISSTTARRIVRNISAPTKTAFTLAQNALLLQEESDVGIEIINKLDFSQFANQVKKLCKDMGFEIRLLCKETGVNKCYLYETTHNLKGGTYSSLYNLLQRLFFKSLQLGQNLEIAKNDISFLKSLVDSQLFFDKTQSIEKFKPDFEYVYDLSVEDHNFCANHLIIHNSYLVSVLLEELSNRKKEDGRIASIILDVHGEYTNFAMPVKDSKYKDYSHKTRLLKARDIKIGVSALSPGLLASMMPSISSAQRRDLAKVMSKLKEEMRNGVGPFGLNEIRQQVLIDKEIKENTKIALLGSIAGLEELNLFAKVDSFSLPDLVRPGIMTVIDLSDVIDIKSKQLIVKYFASRLFNERRQKILPPFLLVLEEAHQFIPEMSSRETALAKGIMETIAREGRKFGCSLCLISQRPIQLSTTVLSQCVSPDTNVMLADGTIKTIGDLENSHKESKLMSCNIESGELKESSISNYIKSDPLELGKKCVEITTESGRKLHCTSNHPLWVKDKGWIDAGLLNIGDSVAILPAQNLQNDNPSIQISWKELQSLLPQTINKNRLFEELNALGLIDSKIEGKKVYVLARLIAHMFGDGTLHSIYKNKQGQHGLKITFSGSEEDLLEIKKDIAFLGFNAGQKICKDKKTSYSNFLNFGIKKIDGTSTYFKTGIVGLWVVLKYLGAPIGDKTNTEISIPKWILEGNPSIKREFLSSLCGSECSSVRWVGRNPDRPVLPFSKNQSLMLNGYSYANQLMTLFKEFDIETSLYVRDYVLRKDGSKSSQFIISLSRSRENLIKFLENINYVYSVKKRINGLYSLEYLKFLNSKIQHKTELFKEVKQSSLNQGSKLTSLNYNMNKKVVENWTTMSIEKVRLAPIDNIPNFVDWIKIKTNGLSNGMLWNSIQSINSITLNDVRDITVPSYHNFFANGFLTHNCNTHIILRITNPYDLKHISESSEALDKRSEEMLTTLRVGEALIVGEAVSFPVFFKVRKRNSVESSHEISLEQAAKQFEEGKEEKEKETKNFL